MMAAETALLGDQSWLETRNKVYQDRRDVVVSTLLDLGFTLEVPKASIYAWAKLPEVWEDSIAFCDKLLRESGVSVTPGEVYGPSGAGYIRISLVTPIEKLSEAMTRMRIWMEKEK